MILRQHQASHVPVPPDVDRGQEPQLKPQKLSYLAQLYFMGEAGLDRGVEFLEELQRPLAEQLEVLEEIEETWSVEDDSELSDDSFYHYLALKHGLFRRRALLEWVNEALALTKARRRRESGRRRRRSASLSSSECSR